MLNTIIAGFKLLRADSTDNKAGHLIDIVRLQVVTKGQAKVATQNKDPLSIETILRSSLLDLIFKYQGTGPLCIQLKKELRRQPDSDQSGSRWLKVSDEGAKGYTLDQRGILYYRGRVLVP